MRKLIISILLVCMSCSMYAYTLRVVQIQGPDFSAALENIGRLTVNGTTLLFYDRQGALLYSTEMADTRALVVEETETSVNNVFVSDKYVVYPNPTTSTLTVKNLGETAILRLYSIDGQLIKTAVGPTMNVENVPNGNYLLQCENQIVKIIKQ